MTTASVNLRGITQVSIRVHDVPAAIRFYQGTLGLPLLFSQSNMALLDCGGIRLLLSVPEKPEFDHPASIVYYKVDDIAQAHESLSGAGVPFIQPPHKVAEFGGFAVWMAFCRDPDGNMLALTSEVPLA